MRKSSVEEYLGLIYRLEEVSDSPLPLSRLQAAFNYSPISIHEMIQKLVKESLVDYVPYRGVTLTETGRSMAAALVRRHRIWERFLSDSLGIGWDKAHEIAGELEHAAPELVTERLADFLGDPQQCPHGSQIPPVQVAVVPGAEPLASSTPITRCLADLTVGESGQVEFISPEILGYLQALQSKGILPGAQVELTGIQPTGYTLRVDGAQVDITIEEASTVWVSKKSASARII